MVWKSVITALFVSTTVLLPGSLASEANHNRREWSEWADTSTTEADTWTPSTTCYTSYYTPTSTWTSVYTQDEVTVTITSYIPCALTSTVIYYTQTCEACEDTTASSTTTSEEGAGTIGYTTVTSYTTVTPDSTTSESTTVEELTSTSDGYVITITTTVGADSAESTVSVYEVSAGVATLPTADRFPWLSVVFLGLFAGLVAVL